MTPESAVPVQVSVALPGPWWTPLTYNAPLTANGLAIPGVRVRVPMGRGTRVGLIVGVGSPDGPGGYDGAIREISEAIDSAPALSEGTMRLLRWFCEANLCGFGTAMKALLPAGFLSGEEIGPADVQLAERPCGKSAASFVYDPIDGARRDRYAAILSDGAPSLVAFPIYPDAEKFYGFLKNSPILPDYAKDRLMLFPRIGGKAEWRAWTKLRSPDCGQSIVVGGQNSAMAPIRGLSRIFVEDESNNAWRTMRPPIHNVRSLLASRARIEGAELILGGRMPSPRAFMRLGAESAAHAPSQSGKKVVFVDMKLAYSPSVEGVSGSLAVSEPLVRETEAAISRGSWAIWILDRKGYAGEIVCEECGAGVKCPRCGCTMRVEAGRISCISCGYRDMMPEECPNCNGRLLAARRPGLEALMPLADAAIDSSAPILSTDDPEEKIRQAVGAARPGLMIGTRSALSFCDEAKTGMIGWIDADGEARSEEHGARVRAFSLIWESLWRGISPSDRRVVVQTRRPGRDWQRGLDLSEGWRVFWRNELQERSELSMPPFTALVKIEGRRGDIAGIAEKLADSGCECWSPDEEAGKKSALWVRTKKLSELRRLLEPSFHIGKARMGFPSVTVWHE